MIELVKINFLQLEIYGFITNYTAQQISNFLVLGIIAHLKFTKLLLCLKGEFYELVN